jgi:hypothetical protein
MAIVVRKSGGDFVPCPAGTWPAVCVDVVDLGDVYSEWKGEKVHKIRLVWQINERMPDGRPYLVQKQYTASLHEKASLRKDLASWRGMDFKPEELNGFDLENVLGVGCLLSIVQQTGNDGQLYGNVAAVMRLPQGYEAPRPDGYVRVIHRDGQPAGQNQPPQGFQQQYGRRAQAFPQQPNRSQPHAHDAGGGWSGPFQPVQPAQPTVQPPYPPQEITDDDVPF